jgi:hypothetical protein
VRLSFELLLMAMNDMIDLRQYIWDEHVASVKIVMLEELISVMDKDTSNFAAKLDPGWIMHQSRNCMSQLHAYKGAHPA